MDDRRAVGDDTTVARGFGREECGRGEVRHGNGRRQVTDIGCRVGHGFRRDRSPIARG